MAEKTLAQELQRLSNESLKIHDKKSYGDRFMDSLPDRLRAAANCGFTSIDIYINDSQIIARIIEYCKNNGLCAQEDVVRVTISW